MERAPFSWHFCCRRCRSSSSRISGGKDIGVKKNTSVSPWRAPAMEGPQPMYSELPLVPCLLPPPAPKYYWARNCPSHGKNAEGVWGREGGRGLFHSTFPPYATGLPSFCSYACHGKYSGRGREGFWCPLLHPACRESWSR